ncbi:carbohydrate binding family 9 domain-containing protein [Granulicella sp. S190]|uniref:carbohydrate binding family 9 domain-containing protein n=1 Tax=Granulicella sp. S190 TaxID=1747226 RepID=UPI00131D5711|nr:carbohydrate binding family 9 domain-containing protein [Granulicella sp. S190]
MRSLKTIWVEVPGSRLRSWVVCGAAIAVLLLSVAPAVCVAQSSEHPTILPTDPPKRELPSEEKVPLLDQPPRLTDFAESEDMQPNAALAAKLGHVTDFIQSAPSDGKPATERTDVWFGRTATAVVFVFVCRDHHPESIRTHLARRENILKDDNVSVLLDSFEDHRRGVLFTVNPSGVQADAAWTENNNPDYSYDQVWDSYARVTKSGWVAMISIPYRSLRFRSGVGGWGVVFMRSLPRNSESDNWPRIAANVSGVLPQEGTLNGIEGVTGSHNLQLNPYGLIQNEHTLNADNPLFPYFSSRSFEGTAGGDAKAILKNSIVLDATINPDFSQVESDQPQFTVNQRYPVFFPELRPFFLENANYFSTPINLLYTRNIVHPEFGVRATGKVGRTNIGFLAIDDRQPGEVYASDDPLRGKHALFAIGRITEDFGKGSSLGVIYTDEEFGGGWNRIGGIDFTARFNSNWTAQGQAVESSTKTVSDEGSAATYSAGPASYLEFTRNGHSFNFDNTYQDFSNGFVSQVGFIQTANIHTDQNHTSYQWYPMHSIFQSIGVETNNSLAFDHQGNRVYHYTNGDPFFAFARKIIVAPLVGENSDTLTPVEYPLLTKNLNLTENYGGIVFRGAPYSQLNFNIVFTHGGNPNYNPPAGAIPFLLHEEFLQALVSFNPLRNVTIDNTYLLDRNHSAAHGTSVFENQTLRTKINYQFTRALSARVIVEYDSLLVNPLQTSLLRTKQVSSEALLTWLPHPGTAIYIGYNNDLQNLDRSLCNRLIGGSCDPDNTVAPRSPKYLNDGRQFFVKASYLLRF